MEGGKENIRVAVLRGSPNKSGSTSILTKRFMQGATEAGYVAERIDLRDKKVKVYIGYVVCGYNGPCVQKDDNEQIKEAVLSTDMIVLTTPLYYFGISAQLETVVDRFCAYNSSINRKNMKSALLTVAWNVDNWTFDALEAYYRTLVKYPNSQDTGMVLGKGCGNSSMTNITGYPEMAYGLGRSC